MSFLYSTARTSIVRSSLPATRAFSTTISTRKTATEAVKDGAKKVDRTVADAAVAGIETGEQLAGKAKEAVGLNTKKAEGAAAQASGEAKGTAAELKGKAAGKAEEVKGKLS